MPTGYMSLRASVVFVASSVPADFLGYGQIKGGSHGRSLGVMTLIIAFYINAMFQTRTNCHGPSLGPSGPIALPAHLRNTKWNYSQYTDRPTRETHGKSRSSPLEKFRASGAVGKIPSSNESFKTDSRALEK